MTAESPIEITHVPPRLRADFTGKLVEAKTGTTAEREANFLSRALAAFAIHKLASCSVDEAATSVVDGGGDGGIDAVHYADTTHVLWVVQSKFHVDGRGEPDLGSVAKFKNGLENLLQGNFEAFEGNAAWRALLPRLQATFKDRSLVVRAVLVYSGVNLVSEDRRRLLEDVRIRFSADSDYLQTQCCNLTTIFDWITGADQAPGVDEVELTLHKPGWVKEPHETIFGLLPLSAVADLYKQHEKRLIAANIRAYKGDTTVNEQIANTVREEPESFFYLNNGLTAYCERLEVNNLDRANAETKRIRAFGFSIVNGAQTLGSIAHCFANPSNPVPSGHVFLKVVSLEKCPDDRSFAERITRSTNFQNQVGARDFAALHEQQARIANQLTLSGVTYHYKVGADVPTPDEANFTLDEATTACASLIQHGDGDICARTLSNRRSLWSFDEVYPETDLYRSRYSKIFRADLSARTIWRAVQVQRAIVAALRTSEAGVRKDFFESCRWLVLNLIFLKLHPQNGEALTLTVTEVSDLTTAAQEYSEVLWTVCQAKGFVSAKEGGGWETNRHFRSVFSAAGDCQILRGALLSALAAIPAMRATASQMVETMPASGITTPWQHGKSSN